MPYHRLGAGKYVKLGLAAPEDERRSVTHDQMQSYLHLFHRRGLPVRGAKEAVNQ